MLTTLPNSALPIYQDFVTNGADGPIAEGPVAMALQGTYNDPGVYRPYYNEDDGYRPTISRKTGRFVRNAKNKRVEEVEEVRIQDFVADTGLHLPVFNATSLRKEEWLELDKVVIMAARYRLRAWEDLKNNNTHRTSIDRVMILEHETASDPGLAQVDMDGLTEGKNDSPQYQLQGLPLAITHVDFFMSKRKLDISRNNPGTSIDVRMGEAGGRRIGEAVERTTIGIQTGVVYGGSSTLASGYGRTPSAVYGYTNFAPRITKTNLTAPTGTNPSSTLADVLAMRDSLRLAKMYGPYMLYHTNDWDQYMDNDYQVFTVSGSNYGGAKTLRQRLADIEGIMDVKRLDMWFGVQPQTNPYYASSTQIGTTGQLRYTGPGGEQVDATLKATSLLMVQMTSDVCRAVVGQDLTVIQWPTMGGLRLNFKAMASYTPQMFADQYGNCGICHATTS